MPFHPSTRPFRAGPLCISLVLAAAVVACGDDEVSSGGGGTGAGPVVGGAGGEGASGGQGGGLGGEGGAGGEAPIAPALRNPVDLPDDQLAYESLLLLGFEPLGTKADTCSDCHSINRGLLDHWRDLTEVADTGCFADPTVPTKASAEEVLTCLHLKTEVPTSPYSTSKLGIYAAAAHLDWFDFVFERVYEQDADTERTEFLQTVAMPKEKSDHAPFTQGEFDIVAEWFVRGLPYMEDFVPDEPPPDGCVPSISPVVAAHVEEMRTTGWRAQNDEDAMLMFGCDGAATTLDCLGTYPLSSEVPFGAGWAHFPGATLRVLRTNNYSSSFWTRSSADGRFVGHGGGQSGNSTIVDLFTDTEIGIDAAYDPAFFPDNSAFMFQGAPGGTGICQLNVLGTDTFIDFNEPECNNQADVGLYQHVGAALGGGDYWSVDGSFVSDNGGHNPTTSNPNAFFGDNSTVTLTPMIYDGSQFTAKPSIEVSTPFEGDTVMSPSSRLLIARVAGGGGWGQSGFRLRKVEAVPSGPSYTVTTDEIGRYCIDGGKPGVSYDERWAVLHRYVTDEDAVELGFTGPGDPAFQQYANQGAANVYLLDLVTGLARRVTHMQPGQYALFPHFRSDGWIYFMVRTVGTNQEHIVASDAALTLEPAP